MQKKKHVNALMLPETKKKTCFQAAAFVSSDPSDQSGWQKLFFSATAAYTFSSVAFCCLAKFEPEPFNFDKSHQQQLRRRQQQDQEDSGTVL